MAKAIILTITPQTSNNFNLEVSSGNKLQDKATEVVSNLLDTVSKNPLNTIPTIQSTPLTIELVPAGEGYYTLVVEAPTPALRAMRIRINKKAAANLVAELPGAEEATSAVKAKKDKKKEKSKSAATQALGHLKTVKKIKPPLGFAKDACTLGKMFPSTKAQAKMVSEQLPYLTGFKSLAALGTNLITLEQAAAGENKKGTTEILTTVLASVKDLCKTLKWLEKICGKEMSAQVADHLKCLSLLSGCLGAFLKLGEHAFSFSSAKKLIGAVLKTINSSLGLFSYFVKNKIDKKNIGYISAVSEIIKNSYDLLGELQKEIKNPSKISMLRLVQLTSCLGLSFLELGLLTQVAYLPIILTSIKLGSDISLYCLDS